MPSLQLIQQSLELEEQLNALKAESEKGAEVTVILQLVRQLALRTVLDRFAIWAALQKLADEATTSVNSSAARYRAILQQVRPPKSSPHQLHQQASAGGI